MVFFSALTCLVLVLAAKWLLSGEIAKSVLYGYLYSLFTISAGFISLQWAFSKPMKTFLAITLGGMMLRFLLLGAVLFLVMRYTDIHFISFVISLVAFYFILQLFEMSFIRKNTVHSEQLGNAR